MGDVLTALYVSAQNGIVKTRKLSVRPTIILFSKTVQDYGKRSADICLVTQAVGQAGHSLSIR